MNATRLPEQLQAEYLFLQGVYEDFDKRALTIKSWSTVLILGGIGAGLERANPWLVALATAAALIIWFLEAKWKVFQYCYAKRIVEIEGYFRNPEAAEITPFQIYEKWFEEWRSPAGPKIWETAILSVVFVPHLLIVAAGVAALAHLVTAATGASAPAT